MSGGLKCPKKGDFDDFGGFFVIVISQKSPMTKTILPHIHKNYLPMIPAFAGGKNFTSRLFGR